VSTACFGSYGHLQVDRLTTDMQAAILWRASCVWWRGVGVGWGYEIWCVLSGEGDVGAWVLLCGALVLLCGVWVLLCGAWVLLCGAWVLLCGAWVLLCRSKESQN